MDGVKVIAGAEIHRFVEGQWTSGGNDEELTFPRQCSSEEGASSRCPPTSFGEGATPELLQQEPAAFSPKRSGAFAGMVSHPPDAAVVEGLVSAPREMTCDFREEALGAAAVPGSGEARAAVQATFQIGEKVAYWSETHNTWMQAEVTKQNIVDGTLVSYDLDVKRSAQVSKMTRLALESEKWEPITPPGARAANTSATSCVFMREVPTPTPLVNAALGSNSHNNGHNNSHNSIKNGLLANGTSALEKAPAAAAAVAAAAAAAAANTSLGNSVQALAQGLSVALEDTDAAARHFDVGDRVEYWSDTYQQWMAATVQRVKEAGSVYDLDVKRGAQARKMRPTTISSDCGPTPSILGQTGLAQPQAASGQPPPTDSSSLAPARATAGALLRGPSPLSGRTRSSASTTAATALQQAPQSVDAAAVAGESDREERGAAPVRSGPSEAVSRYAGIKGSGVTPSQSSAKPKTGLSLPLHHNGSEGGGVQGTAKAGNMATYCTSGSPTSAFSPQVGGGSTPPPLLAKPSGGHTATTTTPAPASGEKAATVQRHSVCGEGCTRPAACSGSGPLFMGTGVEGRRNKEPSASPAHAARSAAATGHRVSLTGAVVSGRRGDAAAMLAPSQPPPPPPPPACAGSTSPACSSTGRGLEVGELDIGSGPFDPTHQSLRSQLIAKLGLGGHTTIEEMQGFRGGLNEGVWFLSDPAQGSKKNAGREELVLKLVKCHRVAQSIPTEAENCLKIYRDHPSVLNDPTVAFPVRIFSCLGTNGTKRYDLIIMRKVRGERLAELIARKWYSKQVPHLMQILEKLGVCLAEFHARYKSSQHGDFQPSNIFYDEERDEIALIDVGGMGVPTMESDVEHFAKSMTLLSEAYGAQLSTDGMRHFERGYAKSAGKG